MCVRFWSVDVLPSPKLQFHVVGVLVEVSLNWTVSGAVPVVGVPEKLATGAGAEPVTVYTAELVAPRRLVVPLS
jgi:hypothetical protein